MSSLEGLRFEQEADPGARAAHRRFERVVAEAPGRGAWACEAGCNFCCHLLVTVTPGEAAVLVGRLTPEAIARVEDRARRAAGLTPGEYRRARIPCAVLDADGRCSAYDARPLKCRAHTSTSREICERVHCGEATTNEVPMDSWLVRAADAIRHGMGEEEEELHAALLRVVTPGPAGASNR